MTIDDQLIYVFFHTYQMYKFTLVKLLKLMSNVYYININTMYTIVGLKGLIRYQENYR